MPTGRTNIYVNIFRKYHWFYTREHKMRMFKLGNYALFRSRKIGPKMAKIGKNSKVSTLAFFKIGCLIKS